MFDSTTRKTSSIEDAGGSGRAAFGGGDVGRAAAIHRALLLLALLSLPAGGCAHLDPDGDGIINLDDQCRQSPEDFDGFEDYDGCPEPGKPPPPDRDGDGVTDADDACPDEASATPSGCPEANPPEGQADAPDWFLTADEATLRREWAGGGVVQQRSLLAGMELCARDWSRCPDEVVDLAESLAFLTVIGTDVQVRARAGIRGRRVGMVNTGDILRLCDEADARTRGGATVSWYRVARLGASCDSSEVLGWVASHEYGRFELARPGPVEWRELEAARERMRTAGDTDGLARFESRLAVGGSSAQGYLGGSHARVWSEVTERLAGSAFRCVGEAVVGSLVSKFLGMAVAAIPILRLPRMMTTGLRVLGFVAGAALEYLLGDEPDVVDFLVEKAAEGASLLIGDRLRAAGHPGWGGLIETATCIATAL